MNLIRPWSMSDAADLAAAINNPNIQDNLRDGIPYPYSVQDARAFIQTVLDAKEGSQYAWAIQADGKAVGSLGIFRKENIHCRTAELGYFLAEPYWSRGLVTKAVKEACAYVFQNTDIIRIFAEPFAYNQGSCRVLEKAGFQFEGTLRSNAVKNGKIIDMRLYSLIREP